MGLLEGLNQLAENNKVHLCWVLGHQGLSGNEKADALARKGTESPLIGPKPVLELPRVLQEARQRFGLGMHTLNCGSILRDKIMQKRFWDPQKGLLSLRKSQIRQVVSLITELYLGSTEVTNMSCCLCGLQEDTVNHVVFECDALERNRRELRLALDSKQGENMDIVSAILWLLKDTDI